jgi:hypothetical protein
MMGAPERSAGVVSGFSLERHAPADHLLRSIERFVDLGDIRSQLRPYYSDMGGLPSIRS